MALKNPSTIKNANDATIIIVAPEVKLNKKAKTKPTKLKQTESMVDKIIIEKSFEQNFSAIYGGIVKSAITKISPTALIVATMQSAIIMIKSV